MKCRVVGILLILVSYTGIAQNRINYSQYMHNHQVFNPAYVEQSQDFGGSALYRNQWFGIEGAPSSFVGNAFYTNGRSNITAQFLYDEITIFKHMEVGLGYSYSVRLGTSTQMVFGLKASYNQQISNYNDLHYFDIGDPNLEGTVKKQGVNMGFGMFFRNPSWHAGLGAPYLFNNGNIDALTNIYNDVSYQHFYLTGGYRAVHESSVSFYPTTMIKWTKGSPLNASLDLNFVINKMIWASAGYRTDKTVILSAGIILWNQFKVIYSYDLGLGEISRYGGMTHEISLGYGMDLFSDPFSKRKFVKRNKTAKGIRTPRRWR